MDQRSRATGQWSRVTAFSRCFLLCYISDSKSFVHYLAKQFWQWKLREFPERATEDGYHEYDDILETYTMENYEYRYVSSTSNKPHMNNADKNCQITLNGHQPYVYLINH